MEDPVATTSLSFRLYCKLKTKNKINKIEDYLGYGLDRTGYVLERFPSRWRSRFTSRNRMRHRKTRLDAVNCCALTVLCIYTARYTGEMDWVESEVKRDICEMLCLVRGKHTV